jgi:NAD(P)-dependent dehydrogenase (short-subunit alcohol dehydrogenase family)
MSLTFSGPVPVPEPQTSPLSILITGASRGLGYEAVVQYAKAHKDNVVIAGVRDTSSAALKALSAYPNVHVVQLDVSKEDSIRASVKETSRYVKAVDVLINNAGIYGALEAGDPVKVTSAQFQEVFTSNVLGPLLTTQAYLPLLRLSSAPKVVSVSSALGSNAFANAFGAPTVSYGLSKAALNYLNTAFRYAEPNVTFLSIHPGWVATDMGKASGGAPPTTTPDSVQAIRYYIAEKTIKNTGEFLDCMTGNTIPY